MAAGDHLQRRQFTPEEVGAHVKGAFMMGDLKPTDRFEKRLVNIHTIEAAGQNVADPHMHPGRVHEAHSRESYSRVARYTAAMKDGGSAHFPPIVVSDNGDGTHEFLDGHHRIHAAANLGIQHAAAYVRVNRSTWD